VLRPGAWIRPNTTASSQPRLLLAIVELVLALLALAAVFGRPFAFLVEPSFYTSVSLYIGGAWGLMLLGLAGLWLPSSNLQQAIAPGNR
jgi:formate-dependent nitrite reductase membrane component NrfD